VCVCACVCVSFFSLCLTPNACYVQVFVGLSGWSVYVSYDHLTTYLPMHPCDLSLHSNKTESNVLKLVENPSLKK
jgi:hypothetical protein